MVLRGAGPQGGGVCVHTAPRPLSWGDDGTGRPLGGCVLSPARLRHRLGLGGAGHPHLDRCSRGAVATHREANWWASGEAGGKGKSVVEMRPFPGAVGSPRGGGGGRWISDPTLPTVWSCSFGFVLQLHEQGLSEEGGFLHPARRWQCPSVAAKNMCAVSGSLVHFPGSDLPSM